MIDSSSAHSDWPIKSYDAFCFREFVMFPWGDYRALRILLLVKQNIWKHYVGGFSFLGYPQSFSDLLVLSLGTGQHPKGHSAREATRWSLIGCPKAPRVDSVLNATADMVDLNISLLFQSEKAGANYLRIQVTHLLHSVLWNTFLLPKRFCILKPWIVYLLSCVELLNFADWQADGKFCINRHLWTWALVAGDWSRDATPGWASHATRLQDWEACTCRRWCNQPRSALQVAPEHFFAEFYDVPLVYFWASNMSWRTLSTITIMKKRLVLLEANIYVFCWTGRIWPVPSHLNTKYFWAQVPLDAWC